MSRTCRRLAALAAAAVTLAATPAMAHPHVWVDAKAEIVFDAKGEVTAIRHIWQFDEDFTAYATLNLDTNNDGKLTEEELTPLAETNMEALHEYGFFTSLYVNNRHIAFAKPTEYWLDFHDKRLTLFYTLPLAKPLALRGPAMLEVGDPEYFVAISFIKNAEVHLENAPPGCTAKYRAPRELDAQTMAILGSIPADQHDLPPDLVQAASVLSNVINLNCPGGGAAPPATTGAVQPAPKPGPASTLTAEDAAISEATPPAVAPAPKPAVEPPVVPDAVQPPPPAEQPGFFKRLWSSIFG